MGIVMPLALTLMQGLWLSLKMVRPHAEKLKLCALNY